MCRRYFIAEDDPTDELMQIIEAVNRRSAEVKTSGEIRPTDTIPVLANTPALQTGSYAMRWGYTMPDRTPVFNARSETAASKAMFKDGMTQRRCIIPASCYFEWEKRGKERIKYAIVPVILPAEALADWLNIRYDAQEVLRAAVVDVGYGKV